MITLKKLQWSNCFSYGPDNEIDLDDTTVTQIIGTNGMGKSSIPLIIEEALYNKNSKGIKKADIPNRYINDGYSITLSFTKDEDRYEIDITRKSTIKVKLLKNGTDISSHTATNTYKSIQELIGVDFKTFSQIVYQNTNASLQFLTATDTNRKKFLIDLLHLDNYVALFETFKSSARTSALEIAKLTGEVEMVEKWLDSIERGHGKRYSHIFTQNLQCATLSDVQERIRKHERGTKYALKGISSALKKYGAKATAVKHIVASIRNTSDMVFAEGEDDEVPEGSGTAVTFTPDDTSLTKRQDRRKVKKSKKVKPVLSGGGSPSIAESDDDDDNEYDDSEGNSSDAFTENDDFDSVAPTATGRIDAALHGALLQSRKGSGRRRVSLSTNFLNDSEWLNSINRLLLGACLWQAWSRS